MTEATSRGAASIPQELHILHELRELAPPAGVWTAAYGPRHLFRLQSGAALVVDTAARSLSEPLHDATLAADYPGFVDGTAWSTPPQSRRRKRPADGSGDRVAQANQEPEHDDLVAG